MADISDEEWDARNPEKLKEQMTDELRERIIEGRLEEAEELALAKDYRSLNATAFFKQHDFYNLDEKEFWKMLEKIDAGIETLDWIS